MPLVTAHSNRAGLDPAVASPTLLAGLGGGTGTGLPAGWLTSSERETFTIRVTAASGRALARLDAVVALDRPPAAPLRFIEWRRDPSPPPASGWPSPADLPPC